MHLSIILLAFVSGSCALPSQSEPFDRTENSKQNKIKNEYILTYPIESGIHLLSTPESRYQNRISRLSKTARVVDTAPINDKHDSVLVQELLAEEIEAIQKDGARVFENKIVTALGIQNKAPWHLSRVNSRALNKTKSNYVYSDVGGKGVDVYVIDTGIDITHPDFEGRASFGASYVGKGAKKQVKDDNGHGTHVAGIVGGKTYGVAKNVHIIAVKCLDGNGAGTSFMIGQAIRFVIREAKKTGRPSIINMSLGTENDDYIDKAANQAIDAGIYIVAAAGKLNLSLFFNFEGNEKEDGCASSPAKVERVLSVGASTNQDKMAPFSNFGPCVDLFAPGVGIESTYKGGMTESLSGTSMASPMVAGALAVLVSETKAKSREEGQAQFLSILTKNRLKLIKNTANLLLFSSNENVIDMSDGNKGIQAPKKPRKPKTPQVPTSRSIEGSKMHYNLRSKSKTLRKPLTGGRRKQCVDMDIESNDDKMEIVNDYESNLDAQDLCA